jgi:hypothetical protein
MVHLVVEQKKRQNCRARGVDGKREIKATVVYRVSLTASVATKINERALSYARNLMMRANYLTRHVTSLLRKQNHLI